MHDHNETAQTEAKEKKDDKEKKRSLLGLEPVETHHELKLKGRRLKYTARGGDPLEGCFW